MNLAGIRNHFANWRNWEFNPIVVKELRQAVRSWAVTGMLLLFLALLFLVSVGFLAFQSANADAYEEFGGIMFGWFAGILVVASVLFIPLYLGVRVAAERQENNPDLFYVSTLSPERIILGKFLCGAYMAVLFFSACMPFMAFTSLLRGVDLPTIFFVLFYLFLIVCTANMAAIFLGCLPLTRPFKVLLAVVGFFGSFQVIVPAIAFSLIYLRSGVGTTMGGADFWVSLLTSVAIGAAVTGLFYILSVELVSPPSSNRAFPVRIYITAIWLFTAALSAAWIERTKHSYIINSWAGPIFFLLLVSLIVVVSNSDELSHRVRKTIPGAPWKRLFAFLLFNGAAGGLIWIALLMAATCLVLDLALPGNEWISLSAAAAYAFAYALAALFIHRTFIPNRTPKLVGLITIIVAAACALTPSIVLFFLNELTWNSIERLELGNAFNIFSMRDDSRLIYHLYFAVALLAVMGPLNARWFFKQVRNFVPPPKEAPPVIAYESAIQTEPLP
jgi:hypothetical protein